MELLKLFKSMGSGQVRFQSLFDRVEKLVDSARLLYTQSEGLQKVVEIEKVSVQKSSSASEEISAMVAMTAEAAQDLNRIAGDSSAAVASSVDSLKMLIEMIASVDVSSQSLQSTVKSGLSEISSITDTMNQIRTKANVINEIVFQTRLLSFNASVEASRAGEHGKGFAVVAEEMGKLAKASGDAAKEIEAILIASVERTKEQIQRVTGELEKAAEQTVGAINAVSSKTNEISSSFGRLEAISSETKSKAQEISSATAEQKIGIQEISKALADLAASSEKLDSMAVEGNQSAAQLADVIETISKEFVRVASTLGYTVSKTEAPFDFEAAIRAHIDWKMKLSKYLDNPDGSLHHEKVCVDNACALGKWIYGDGQNHRSVDVDLFENVRSSHAAFHQAAGEIVEQINAKNAAKARHLLGPSGTYLSISDRTVDLIKQLRDRVQNRDHA